MKNRARVVTVVVCIFVFLAIFSYYILQGSFLADDEPSMDVLDAFDIHTIVETIPEGNCYAHRTCGEIIGADCGLAVDGSYLFIDTETKATVGICGGNQSSKSSCPPEEWKCDWTPP